MIFIHICIILFATHSNESLNQKVGGIANQVLQLLPAYEKINGLKVSVFSKYSKYKPNTNRIKIYNIQKFSNIQKFALRTVNTLYFYLKFFIKVKKLAKEDPIHLIHQQNYGFYLMGPLVVAKILHIPILIKTPADIKSHMMHAYLSRQHGIITKMLIYGWFNLFKKIIIKKIDFIQALNDRIYDDLISLNFPKGNILKLPNGICLDNFQNIKKINKEFTTFGYIGRLEKHKNVDFLLHTFKEYLKIYPSDKLYIFGKGTEAKNLTTIISENDLNQNVVLYGFEKDKNKMYSNIDVLINPSYGEGISNVILEAMSTDTFVIASNVHGNNDIIVHKFSGLLFNPHIQKELLEQLFFYKENSKAIQNIISNAKNEILIKYEINAIAKSIFEFLKTKLL